MEQGQFSPSPGGQFCHNVCDGPVQLWIASSPHRASDAFTQLRLLHLDHEQDAVVTCDLWKRAMPSSPIAWDDGVEGGLLCHLLFSVTAKRDSRSGDAAISMWSGSVARSQAEHAALRDARRRVALTKPDELTTLNSRIQRVHAQVGLEPEEHEFGQRPAEK